ncbi:MAG: alanine dehydrogenase [Peptococcaceae bacterium]|jgi:alanine dehydrogenase|nr:alanine dehydrogenase [Peptococcaceae bacterium]
MIIGVPKEIKPQENRVGLTPAGVDALTKAGHKVYLETNAGIGTGITDKEYKAAGGQILPKAADIYEAADMLIKVKEPLAPEYGMLKKSQILFTYLHLAPDPKQAEALLKQKVIAVAYETVQLSNGALPLLSPMSEVAGRMSVQVGAWLLEKNNGGAGILLGGVPGVEPARVVIVGGGNVGINAVKAAVGMGAQVIVLDVSGSRLSYLDDLYRGRIITLMSNNYNIAESVKGADLLIGAVLIPGAKTPKLVDKDMVKSMRAGSVIVDVAIDQGGTVETIDRITTHENPYFVKYGVTHYSVANMPGAVPRTSTFALTNATLPFALKLASLGAEQAMKEDPALMKGLNVYKGKLTFQAVAEAQGKEYTPPEELF